VASLSVVGRVRRGRLSPEQFRRIAIVALTALWIVIVSGAVVRLTGSGLGCDNWPRCGDTPFPERDFHPLVEFGNRVVAFLAIVLTCALAVAARRTPGLGTRPRRLALAAAVGTVFQIPLGGITVLTDLHPVAVMSHFLLSIVVLAAATVVALDANRFARPRRTAVAPSAELRWLGLLALAVLPLAAVLLVTGTVVTAAGPHPGARVGSDGEPIVVKRIGEFWPLLRVHVWTTGAFGIAFLGLVAGLWRMRRDAPRELRLALGVLALLGAQAVVGEVQKSEALPWPLVLVHVALAAASWSGIVALTVRLAEVARVEVGRPLARPEYTLRHR
jgi:cytochrome c oxidase assembly protein subunit 15